MIHESGFYDLLLADVLRHAGVTAAITPPGGVEASVREGDGRRLLFLVNHTEEVREVDVPSGTVGLLTGATSRDSLMLGRLEVAVLALSDMT